MAGNKVITRDQIAKEFQEYFDKYYAKFDANMTLSDARREVEWLFGYITETLAGGNEIRVHGLGAWKIKTRKAGMRRNPQTGEAVHVPARKVIRFSPSTSLNAMLRGGRKITSTMSKMTTKAKLTTKTKKVTTVKAKAKKTTKAKAGKK